MDGISGTVINEVFRQIKAGEFTINTSTEFCRADNKYVPSMKPLFQRTIGGTKQCYLLAIHPWWLTKRRDKNDAPTSFFGIVKRGRSSIFTRGRALPETRLWKDKRSFFMMKACFALCLKRYVRETNAKDWLKHPICLQYVICLSM